MTIDTIMRTAPVIPVLVLDGSVDPAALAETLVAAGLPVLEVTLRTPQALDAIRAMSAVPGAIVGAGTVLNPNMHDEAVAAGSQFIVSPGLTEPLGRAAIVSGIPFLPGVANAGDIMRGLDMGLDRIQILPGRGGGRIEGAGIARRAIRQHPFLPDRWDHRRQRAILARPPLGNLCRRKLDRQVRRSRSRRDRESRPSSRRTERLT